MDTPFLPEEIIEQILEHHSQDAALWTHKALFDLDSYTTLRNACLSSHAFRRIARPILYRNIFISSTDPAKQRQEMTLLELLLRYPDIATYVHGLRCTQWPLDSSYRALMDPPNPSKSSSRIKERWNWRYANLERCLEQAVQTFTTPDSRPKGFSWGKSISGELLIGGDAAMVIILGLCVNLETWRVDMPKHCSQSLIVPCLAQGPTAGSSPEVLPLQRLRRLYVGRYTGPSYYARENPSEALQPLLALPSLSSLRYYGVGSRNLERLKVIRSHVRSIELYESYMDVAGIACLLRSCPQASSLVIRSGIMSRHPPSLGKGLTETLQQYGRNLSHITLRHPITRTYPHPGRIPAMLGSLRSLHSLRSLSISTTLLCNKEHRTLLAASSAFESQDKPLEQILPTSIQKLEIHDWDVRYGNINELIVNWILCLMSNPYFSVLCTIRVGAGAHIQLEEVEQAGWTSLIAWDEEESSNLMIFRRK